MFDLTTNGINTYEIVILRLGAKEILPPSRRHLRYVYEQNGVDPLCLIHTGSRHIVVSRTLYT